jgi:protein arginine kinase activator
VFAEDSPDWNLDADASGTCEVCGEEAATVHLLRVEGGAVTHSHLCHACAQNMAEQNEGMALVLALPQVLKQPSKDPAEKRDARRLAEAGRRTCEVCGTTMSDLKESGLVGCAHCYEVFAEYLESAVVGQAEEAGHLGKVPQRGSEGDSVRHEISRLERMLRELVECERFEEAASVRDRLNELSREQGGAAG